MGGSCQIRRTDITMWEWMYIMWLFSNLEVRKSKRWLCGPEEAVPGGVASRPSGQRGWVGICRLMASWLLSSHFLYCYYPRPATFSMFNFSWALLVLVPVIKPASSCKQLCLCVFVFQICLWHKGISVLQLMLLLLSHKAAEWLPRFQFSTAGLIRQSHHAAYCCKWHGTSMASWHIYLFIWLINLYPAFHDETSRQGHLKVDERHKIYTKPCSSTTNKTHIKA